jgi:hypothetical protein
LPLFRVRRDSGTNIYIQQAVIIDIDNGNAAAPPAVTIYLCNVRNVLKSKIPFIQIELTGHLIACKINIRKAVIIKIPDTYPATVIHIWKIERVYGIVLDDMIIEMYIGMIGRDKFKQPLASLT